MVSSRAPRGWLRTLAYFVPIALLTLYTHRDLFTDTQAPTTTAHPEQSLNVALNAAYCGKPQMYSQRYSVQTFLSTRPDLMKTPFRNVIAAMAGSVDTYCHYANEFVVVSENSLMWLIRLALWQNVHLTPDELGDFLGAIRIGMVLVFGFALLRTGASVLFAFAAVMLGADVLTALGVRDSIYPFVTSMPLFNAGLYGIALSMAAVRRGGPGFWVFALVMGVVAGFCASMRTVHLPMLLAMFAVCLAVLAVVRDRAESSGRFAGRLAAGAAAFLVGYNVYLAVLVTPLRISNDPSVSNYKYHTLMHEVVMGLAIPPNDFAKREGIEWNDSVGASLALRVNPTASYLGEGYEAALLRYYAGLWRAHPREMFDVYALKGWSDGNEVFLSAGNIAHKRYAAPLVIGETLHRTTNGYVLMSIILVALAAALWRYVKTRDLRVLVIGLVALAAAVSMVEGFVAYSIFVGIYYSSVLYFVLFLAIVLIQTAVDAAAARVQPR